MLKIRYQKNTKVNNLISYGMQTVKNLKSKSRSVLWTVVAFLLFSPVGVVLAEDTGGNPIPKLQNPIKVETLPDFLKLILKAVVTISTPIIVLMIVYSGFLFIKAQGNSEELAKAKKAIMYTIIGAIIILGAAVLSEAIKGTVDDIQTQSFYTINKLS